MNTDTMKTTKHYIVETISYDGESIDEIQTLDGPFDTAAEAEKAFAEIAEDYEDNDEATVDEDNFGIVYYEGNGETHNILIMEAPAVKIH